MKVPESLYGKRGKCPKCGGVIDIPEEVPGVEPSVEPVMPQKETVYASQPERECAERAKYCHSCGSDITADALFCRRCGTQIGAEPKIGHPAQPYEETAMKEQQQQLTPSQAVMHEETAPCAVPSFDELEARGRLVRPPEYPNNFNPRGFCWPAFWFGPLWYFLKGMINKGLLLFGIAVALVVFTIGIGALIMPLLYGFMGYRDYSRYYSTKKQFWW